MLELYWGLFIAGLILAFITIVFGEFIEGLFEGVFEWMSMDGMGFMHPIIFVGGMTTFGGAGIVLNKSTTWSAPYVALIAFVITIVMGVLLYFGYVRPMRYAENSIGYSVQDLIGKVAEVSVAVPADGYGEVIVKIGAGRVNEIASSYNQTEIQRGTQVVIVDVEDRVVRITPFDSHTLI